MLNLPFDVMEIIVSKMTFQDVLTYPDIEGIRQVILLCPEEWHTKLFEYIKHVRDISNVKINIDQANSYLIMEDTDVSSNAILPVKEQLFSLRKLCDGLLAKYGTTYNWRAKQFQYLLNDDVNWNIDNIKIILHDVLLYYCNRLGFHKNTLIQKIDLLKPYINQFVYHNSRIDMQKGVFEFIINNFYEGNAKLLYAFISGGENQVSITIWNDYCAQILKHVEEDDSLRDKLMNIGTSLNWNVDNIKDIVSICSYYNIIMTSKCHDLIIKGIVGTISIKEVRTLLQKDKRARYKRLCNEQLVSSGILIEDVWDLMFSGHFDEFYHENAIDKYVATIVDFCKIKSILASKGIEMIDGCFCKDDDWLDEYVSFDVWDVFMDYCRRIHGDPHANIYVDESDDDESESEDDDESESVDDNVTVNTIVTFIERLFDKYVN